MREIPVTVALEQRERADRASAELRQQLVLLGAALLMVDSTRTLGDS